MQYLTKHLRGMIMIKDENQIIQQINSIDDNLEKLERNSNRNSDQVGPNMVNNISLYYLFGVY